MEYAMKSLSLLYPKSLSRCTAVSTSVVTQQLLSEPSPAAPRTRPYRVSTADRSVRKGIMAHSLEDLLHKGSSSLGPLQHAGHRPHAARHLLLHAAAPGCPRGRTAPQGQGPSPHPCLSEDNAMKAQVLGGLPQPNLACGPRAQLVALASQRLENFLPPHPSLTPARP
uniref:Cell death inducing DFFA like effector c n=1 Tax=Equus asinus TaxID=9793 RepID=A0A9L0K0V7_EQUAS